MDKFFIIRILHFIYLGLLLIFIAFYFTAYQPFKLHGICAEKSAKTILKSEPIPDAYDLYQGLYKNCISQNGKI
ncbi:MAG: hypothetical protein AAB414_04730 [Patescibacteria group bacterium]